MVTNKSLALLIVAAVLFSLGSQMASIVMLGNYEPEPITPTGHATSQRGLINFSIRASADISLPNATVDFGTGAVNGSGCNFAQLSNNGSGYNIDDCWLNDTYFAGSTKDYFAKRTNEKFILQVDGNRNVTITMSSTKESAANFIGNCSGGQDHNWYRYAINVNGSGTKDTCPDIVDEWRNISSGTLYVCNETNWDDDEDAINVVFNLSICANNDVTGYRNDNLTFTSTTA